MLSSSLMLCRPLLSQRRLKDNGIVKELRYTHNDETCLSDNEAPEGSWEYDLVSKAFPQIKDPLNNSIRHGSAGLKLNSSPMPRQN